MIDHDESSDARLERLRLATDAARPRADFGARVAAAVERDAAATGASADWFFDLWRPARRLLPVAALAAALGIVWAARTERAWNDASTASRNSTELDAEW